MTIDQLASRIREKMGIASLNEMQHAMAASPSNEIVLLAPTGSGKTLAFTLPLLLNSKPSNGTVQAVVIAPSRELVTQIASVIRPLALPLKTVAFYGGHSMLDETKSLSATPDIIVATPGRLLDHLNRSNLDLKSVRTLVLDEYDKSLELGFHDEMRRISKRFGRIGKIVLTSATTLQELPDFLRLSKPTSLDFTKGITPPAKRMDIVGVQSPARDKLDTLLDLVGGLGHGSKSIVFVNHRESAERTYNALRQAGFPVGIYHGGLDQLRRELAVDLLNNGTTPILVSTDLASRGLDIAEVESVIHYHLPPTLESWTHRNGRTARQKAKGTIYVITSEGENIPDHVTWQREFFPRERTSRPEPSDVTTLYFNLGKKEKISRGDIAGYLIQKGGLTSAEVSSIIVKDHCSLAAIPATKATSTIKAIAPHKLKNQRVRVSEIG